MNISSTTYTMLVTIAHDDGAAISTELLEAMIQRGLEEGVREFAGVHAATVSAIAGDVLGRFQGGKAKTVTAARKLHEALRAI